MVSAADIVNQAILFIGGDEKPVTGNAPLFDDSRIGKVAGVLYAPCVQTIARQFGWDFSRSTKLLTLSGNPAPFPWAVEYLYPTMGIQVRQLMPSAVTDTNNPLPVNWAVANTVVAGTSTKVIHTNQAAALAVFTGQPTEDTWDAEFRETVVRLLASEFAVALAGRPDTARDLFDSAERFEKTGETRDS